MSSPSEFGHQIQPFIDQGDSPEPAAKSGDLSSESRRRILARSGVVGLVLATTGIGRARDYHHHQEITLPPNLSALDLNKQSTRRSLLQSTLANATLRVIKKP